LHDPITVFLIHPCDGRTDGRSDRQTGDSICALCISSVAR